MDMEQGGDDGRIRTGNVRTATALVGSGVLTLPWSVAQLGWILGPFALVFFAFITYHTAILLSDCYRSRDPNSGRRNYKYMDVIKEFRGEKEVLICGITQHAILWGTMVGYTITGAMSMMAIELSDCFHEKGRDAECKVSGTSYAVIFGVMEIALSQLPNLEKISFLSYIAAAMSVAYSSIGLCLCLMEFSSHPELRGALFGVEIASRHIALSTKIWHSFQALGNIAFAYTFAMLLIEIQDTLRAPPPENKTMNKASACGIGATTLFYISLGCVGYAAFGSDAPGNILTGFYEPFWLIDIANVAVLVHLVGAYQIFAQPIFAFYEQWLAIKWPNAGFLRRDYSLGMPFAKSISLKFTLCKLLLRTILVIFTTVVAMLLPFFNAIAGLIGSLGFWPLTVCYPVSMYIKQANIKRGRQKWVMLQVMSMISLLITVVAIIGSIADIVQHLDHAKLFKMEL